MDSFIRVIPTTPRMRDVNDTIMNTDATGDDGIFVVYIIQSHAFLVHK